MKLLGHIKSRSKLKNDVDNGAYQQYATHKSPPAPYQRNGYSRLVGRLPTKVIQEILACVCPHTLDEEYTTSEESMIADGCMLCDMRDLAQCAMVCRRWAEAAQNLLYHSVRVDAVHYCEREEDLSAKRKRRSFFERNGDAKDAPQQRLSLFSRTVRENGYLGALVQYLKMPYMTRETCKADLSRTVSMLPNLRYIDLPEGFYSDDPSSNTLKQELQHRCPDIRKMKYLAGSEGSFTMLAHTRHWQNLECLEISNLNVDPSVLLYVLASIPALHDLRIADVNALDDDTLTPNPNLPPFPPLNHLTLENTPNVSEKGLLAYLSRPETRETLSTMTLSQTGIAAVSLHQVLHCAPFLTELTISETVSHSFPLTPTPPLASSSLETLRYLILSSTSSLQPPSETYYNYLSNSIQSGSLPVLTSLYALSPSLPDLLLTPPTPGFSAPSGGGGGGGRHTDRFSTTSSIYSSYLQSTQSARPLSPGARMGGLALSPTIPPPNQIPTVPTGIIAPLSLYTKSAPELEWNLTLIDPPSARNNRRGSFTPTRPVSLYTGHLSPLWSGGSSSSGGLKSGGSLGPMGSGGNSSLLTPSSANNMGMGIGMGMGSPRHGKFSSSSMNTMTNSMGNMSMGAGAGAGMVSPGSPGFQQRPGSVMVGNGFGGFLAVPSEEVSGKDHRGRGGGDGRVRGKSPDRGRRGEEGWMG